MSFYGTEMLPYKHYSAPKINIIIKKTKNSQNNLIVLTFDNTNSTELISPPTIATMQRMSEPAKNSGMQKKCVDMPKKCRDVP